jgi:segregation and condensation protein A
MKLVNVEAPSNRIFNLLLKEDELTWQTIIYELVKTEEMDPWDIDVSLIAQKFLQMLKKLKEMDFRISGKIVLASAILLKIKSNRLVKEDLVHLDRLMSSTEDPLEVLEELSEDIEEPAEKPKDKYQLHPRTPQPRKRKVSVYDLIEALEKALEVENRRKQYVMQETKVVIPEKKKDMSLVIQEVYDKICDFFNKKTDNLTFDQLVPSDTKEDKVLTFIPLLHLDTQRKIEMEQERHLAEIYVQLLENKS